MSGSRGPSQSNNRYMDYDYDYGSSKPPRSKKPPFNALRRDFSKGLPGSSSLTHSMGASDDYVGSSGASGRRYGSSRGGGSGGGAYGSYSSGIYGNSQSNSSNNNSSPGAPGSSSGVDRYGGYNKPWRSSSGGELKSMNAVSSSTSGGLKGTGNRVASTSSIPYQSVSPGGGSGDSFRKDRYDSYSGGAANGSSFSGRNSLSNSGASSRPYGKRLNSYGSSNSMTAVGSSGTDAVGAGLGPSLGAAEINGSSSLLNSTKRSDTYYPSRNYSSLSQSGGKVDRYSSKYRGGFKGKSKRYGEEDQRRDYYAYQHHPQHQQSQHGYQGGRIKDEERSYDRYTSGYKDERFKSRLRKESDDADGDVDLEADVDMDDADDDGTRRTNKLAEKDLELRKVDSDNNDDDEEDEDNDEDEDMDEEEDDDDNENEKGNETSRSTTTEPHSTAVTTVEDSGETVIPSASEKPSADVSSLETKTHRESISESKPKLFLKTPVDVSNEIMYEEGCIYPLNFMETEFDKLKEEFKRKTETDEDVNKENEQQQGQAGLKLPYSTKQPIKNFQDLPFYSQNIGAFVDYKLDKLSSQIKENNRVIQRKKLSLWNKSDIGWKKWQIKSKNMDQQLKLIHPPDDEMRKEIDSIDIRVKSDDRTNGNGGGGGATGGSGHDVLEPVSNGNSTAGSTQANGGGGRRNRRHGDLVTTEAEFQEILDALEKEQLEDPMVKAQHLSAKIPDFILDPVKKDCIKYMDSNNLVVDKQKWSKRVHTDFQDTFSYEEHELFCEGFCMTPKRFGAISRHMGSLRTAEECVLHYYLTKKAVNYKLMVNQFKKKANKRASGGRRKSAKSRNTSQSNTPITTPLTSEPGAIINSTTANEDLRTVAAEVATQVEIVANSKPVSEELYTETGRRKRAAAPVFKESNDNADPSKKKQARRREENIVSAVETSEASSVAIVNETEPVKPEFAPNQFSQLMNPEVPEVAPHQLQHQLQEQQQPAVAVAHQIAPNDIPSGHQNTAVSAVLPVVAPSNISEGDVSQEISEDADKFSENKDKKRAITSYWSITEANLFPGLLAEHGTKWTTIADILSTKTATMVRNYFQRNSEKHGWGNIVKDTDARLEAKFAAVLGQDATVPPAKGNPSNTVPLPVTGSTATVISNPVANALQVPVTTLPFPQTYEPKLEGGLKIGTFQHTYSKPFQELLPPVTSRKPSINSLLLNDSSFPHYKPYPNIFSLEPSIQTQPHVQQPIIQSQHQQPIHSHVALQQLAQAVLIPSTETPVSQHTSPPIVAKQPQVHVQAPTQPQRSSIMSLLNSDSSPGKNSYTPVPQPSNSLKSLLNSPPNQPQQQFEPSQRETGRTPSGNGISTLLSAASSQPFTPSNK